MGELLTASCMGCCTARGRREGPALAGTCKRGKMMPVTHWERSMRGPEPHTLSRADPHVQALLPLTSFDPLPYSISFSPDQSSSCCDATLLLPFYYQCQTTQLSHIVCAASMQHCQILQKRLVWRGQPESHLVGHHCPQSLDQFNPNSVRWAPPPLDPPALCATKQASWVIHPPRIQPKLVMA